jgi:formaldehyde dismutase / methanol dehydrogenase
MYSFEKFRMTYHEEIKQFPLHMIGGFNGAEMIGWGAVKMTGEILKQNGVKHALLVTTGLKGTGIIEEVQAICKHAGVETTIFKVGQTNPRVEDVEKGFKAFNESGADGFLSVGGGSSHDTTKMIRMRLANPDLTLNESAVQLDPHFMEIVPNIKPCLYTQVAVNTTAGTGAEMTGFAVVTDWEAHWKYVLVAANMLPVQGIMDPALLRTMPERIAAQTGMDCFVHGMGGYVSRLKNEHARATGMRGAKLCWENLPEFTYNRLNDKACEAMAWAQYLGALTYALGGGVGMIHAHAHQISAVNNLHHGLTNAMMMIPVVKRNYPADPEGYADLARDCFGIDTRNMDRLQAAEACYERMLYFRNIVGIDEKACTLSTYGLTEKDAKHMSKHTINDLCYEASARDMTEEESFELYMSVM